MTKIVSKYSDPAPNPFPVQKRIVSECSNAIFKVKKAEQDDKKLTEAEHMKQIAEIMKKYEDEYES